MGRAGWAFPCTRTGARAACLCALLLALVSGCSPAGPSSNEHLAAIDYWPEQQLLFVATPRSGAIDVLRVPASSRQGSLDFVERLTEPTRQEVLRIAVDRTKGRLWAADRRIIYVYQFRPRGPSTQIAFGSPNAAAISDLVIDAEGNGFVLVAGGARIYRISSESLRAENWLETTYASLQTTTLSPSRALVTKDGRQVIFQSPKDGALLRVDFQSKRALKIERSSPIALDCAALLWNDYMDGGEGSITAFPCRGRPIGEIQLDAEMKRSRERYVTLTR